MGKFIAACLAFAALSEVSAFSPLATRGSRSAVLSSVSDNADNNERHPDALDNRADFLRKTASAIVAATSLSVVVPTDPAHARGRATLEQAYDRYSSRIIDGGNFYKTALKKLINKDDWAGIQVALQEPPKKTKADNVKIDGGIQERAAQAGKFSDARVLVALDLLAAQFSDNSISAKTKSMKKDVDEIRGVVNEMQSICRQALGEESSGGLFGKKQADKKELSKRMRELYLTGGNAWNRYAFVANEGLPKTVQRLPLL